MKNRDRVLFGLGIGLLVGGATGYFLASDEGKKVRKKAKKNLKKLNNEVRHTLQEQSSVLAEKINAAGTNTQNWVNEVTDTVKNKISTASDAVEDTVDDAQDSFQKGIAMAKRNINEKANTVEEIVEKS